jgi:DNA-binding MarR family transcriptional regulator
MSPSARFSMDIRQSPAEREPGPGSEAGLRRELEVWASLLAKETGDGKHLGDHAVVDHWASAVGYWLVDANLLADADNLHLGLEALRDAHTRLPPGGPTSRLEAMVTVLAETVRASLDRARQARLAENLDPNSWAARMLVAVADEPGVTSTEIVKRLCADESQISRSGRALVERGLAVKTRHGRVKGWSATPRGGATADRLRERSVD